MSKKEPKIKDFYPYLWKNKRCVHNIYIHEMKKNYLHKIKVKF